MSDSISATLYRELEDGTEQELEVEIAFSVQPAEPDVGIMGPYAEDFTLSTWIPVLGWVSFDADEIFDEQITAAVDKYLENGGLERDPDYHPHGPDYE